MPYEHFFYLPFGEVAVHQHANNDGYSNPYQFSLSEFDDATGLILMGARYYDPMFSLWMSADPMSAYRSWLTPYNYVANNPVMFVDPSGLLESSVKTGDEKARGGKSGPKGMAPDMYEDEGANDPIETVRTNPGGKLSGDPYLEKDSPNSKNSVHESHKVRLFDEDGDLLAILNTSLVNNDQNRIVSSWRQRVKIWWKKLWGSQLKYDENLDDGSWDLPGLAALEAAHEVLEKAVNSAAHEDDPYKNVREYRTTVYNDGESTGIAAGPRLEAGSVPRVDFYELPEKDRSDIDVYIHSHVLYIYKDWKGRELILDYNGASKEDLGPEGPLQYAPRLIVSGYMNKGAQGEGGANNSESWSPIL